MITDWPAEAAEARHRIVRGFARLTAPLRGVRPYRHANEQANHAEQAAMTATSIGLMAVAATHSDDEHRIQALQTEATLVSRQVQLERNHIDRRGLTAEERGELASIRRMLADLHQPAATPERLGLQRLAAFGPVGSPLGLIGMFGGVRLWMVLASGMALTTGAAAIQTARLSHAKHDLTDARDTAIHNAEAAAAWQARAGAYATALGDAQHAAQTTAHTLESERAVVARARRREQQRAREIQSVLAHGDPPAWRLRDDPPADLGAPAPIPAPTGHPG